MTREIKFRAWERKSGGKMFLPEETINMTARLLFGSELIPLQFFRVTQIQLRLDLEEAMRYC